jgi:hypothetical protein
MKRCKGKTVAGNRCKKTSVKNSAYCAVHQEQAPKSDHSVIGSIIGIVVGALFAGWPGAVVGGVSGRFIGKAGGREIMSKSKVFVSYDYDHDSDIKTLLVNQARFDDSPFAIEDWSVKEHLTGNWKERVRSKLKCVDQVVVLCGERTYTAIGVSAEIELAQEVGVPYFLLKGRTDKECQKPKAAKSSDRIYKWSWSNLKSLIGGSR